MRIYLYSVTYCYQILPANSVTTMLLTLYHAKRIFLHAPIVIPST
jgi:hypothetical protein